MAGVQNPHKEGDDGNSDFGITPGGEAGGEDGSAGEGGMTGSSDGSGFSGIGTAEPGSSEDGIDFEMPDILGGPINIDVLIEKLVLLQTLARGRGSVKIGAMERGGGDEQAQK